MKRILLKVTSILCAFAIIFIGFQSLIRNATASYSGSDLANSESASSNAGQRPEPPPEPPDSGSESVGSSSGSSSSTGNETEPEPGYVDYYYSAPSNVTATVGDGNIPPKLLETNTSYVYITAFGNYTFDKLRPDIMSLTNVEYVSLVEASTFSISSDVSSTISNPSVISANNTTFQASYTLTGAQTQEGTVTITTNFFEDKWPKISVNFVKDPNSTIESSNIVWKIITVEAYLKLSDNQTFYFGDLTSLEEIRRPEFSAEVGNSSQPFWWQSSLIANWSDIANGTLFVGPVTIDGISSGHGLFISFPLNQTAIDPTLVGTSIADKATAYSNQKKTFFYGGYYWSFYYDGKEVVYEYSNDGLSWSGPLSVDASGGGWTTLKEFTKLLLQGGAKNVRDKLGIGSWNTGTRLGFGILKPGGNVIWQKANLALDEGLAGGGLEVMAKGSDFVFRGWTPFYLP